MDIKSKMIPFSELVKLNPDLGKENRKTKYWEYLIVL